MRDLLPSLLHWWHAGEPAGLARVTATWASAPREAGAAMAVGPDGTVLGSVSGGCVEGAVYDLCRAAAADRVARTSRFGVSDAEAFAVGLTCGGTVELLVEPVDRGSFPHLPALADAVAGERPVALLTRVTDGEPARHLLLTPDGRDGSLGSDWIDDAVTGDGRGLLAAGRTGLLEYGPGERVLVDTFPPAARMLVFGSTDQAAAMARIGAFLGYRITVCDARPVFTTACRFPDAAEVVVDWPHRYLAAEARSGRLDQRTVLVVLTHEPKFDLPLLEIALRLPVAYVGAMGSRRTHDERRKRLADAGLADDDLDRLASPVGLDLGGRTPEETAISIAAEIVALRRGGTGARLSHLDGPIHP
jgi:xanthine dehydrogenase accessory factor